MNSTLSSEQLAYYRENGFVVQHDFLSPAELEQWRTVFGEAVAKRNDQALPGRALGTTDQDDYYQRVFTQRINLWQDNPAAKPLILDPRIGRMCCELEGIEGIRVWHDQALFKGPWGNPTAWHLDNPYWSFSSHHSISIWVALDDATAQNGCLYFMPGSHREARFENVGIGQNFGDLFRLYPQWKDRAPVPAPMKAGSCSFHNGLTAHGAGANITPYWRRAMTCAFMPDGATFNGIQNILTTEQFARLKVGDVIADDAQNPIVWRRSMAA